MAAIKHKLKIEQGTTFRKPFTWTAAGVPVDLTGWTARMQIRPSIASTVVLVELTTENGGIGIDGVAGKITLYMSATATAALTFESGEYDLELVNAVGDVRRLLSGGVSLSLEVTR